MGGSLEQVLGVRLNSRYGGLESPIADTALGSHMVWADSWSGVDAVEREGCRSPSLAEDSD